MVRRRTILDRTTRVLAGLENGAAVAILAAMVLLPIVASALRTFTSVRLIGATEYLQHCCLWIAFIGAALASRRGRHLRLSTGTQFLSGRLREGIDVFQTAVSVAVVAAFVLAGFTLVNVERSAAAIVAPFLPSWIAQLVMPVFMLLVGIRLVVRARGGWRTKSAIVLATGLILSMYWVPEAIRPELLIPGMVLLIAAVLLGAPLFVLLGGAGLFLFFIDGMPVSIVPAEAYRIVASPVLPTIPLFTLAGYVLTEGGASQRLVGLFRVLFGWMRGGVAVATILVCAFFTTFTGASSVTILALGGILFPILMKENYPEKFSLGLITASGSVGILLPPALPVILYGVVAATPIDKMFIAGIVPGILLVTLMSIYGFASLGRRGPVVAEATPREKLLPALKRAKWDLLLPVLVTLGVFGGFTTLVETAALTAFYAIIMECFVHKSLKFTTCLPRTMVKCAILVGGVLIILGLAFGFTSYLIDAQAPAAMFEWVHHHISSKLAFLLALNLFLVVVGCIMDVFSALVVVVPILIPIAMAYGVDPIHLGIIFLVNLELGYLTPPVGLNLFLSAYRFGLPLTRIYKTVVPFILIRVAVLAAVTYIPLVSMGLGRLFK